MRSVWLSLPIIALSLLGCAHKPGSNATEMSDRYLVAEAVLQYMLEKYLAPNEYRFGGNVIEAGDFTTRLVRKFRDYKPGYKPRANSTIFRSSLGEDPIDGESGKLYRFWFVGVDGNAIEGERATAGAGYSDSPRSITGLLLSLRKISGRWVVESEKFTSGS